MTAAQRIVLERLVNGELLHRCEHFRRPITVSYFFHGEAGRKKISHSTIRTLFRRQLVEVQGLGSMAKVVITMAGRNALAHEEMVNECPNRKR